MKPIEKIVLVHRLREVVSSGGLHSIRVRRPGHRGRTGPRRQAGGACPRDDVAARVREQGEGIFLQFNAAYLTDWVQKPRVVQQGSRLKQGFDAWKADHQNSSRYSRTTLYRFARVFASAVDRAGPRVWIASMFGSNCARPQSDWELLELQAAWVLEARRRIQSGTVGIWCIDRRVHVIDRGDLATLGGYRKGRR